MVYTSTHLSLAALEVFVHLEVRTEPDDLVSVMAELPVEQDVLLQQGEALLSRLPRDWRSLENRALREIGASWIASASSLALMVPSAVIEEEWNVLLNPAHPDAHKIALAEPKTFQFDPRMFRGRR
jgi:RES domain-containing protein